MFGMCITAVVDLITSRWTDGNDSFKQLNSSISLAKSVLCFTNILLVLELFNCDSSEDCVDMLVIIDEMCNSVMLVGGQLFLFTQFIPLDGRGRIGGDLTLKIHVKLKCLT